MAEPAHSDQHKIMLRMGGFHTEMSFVGCIGHLMDGSGIYELLELLNAKNTIEPIMNGKAISRAVMAHFLINAILNKFMLCFFT